MLRTVGLYALCIAGIAVSAENVNIWGTVSSDSGRPVKGAVVTLQGQKLSDTTDSDGAYLLKAGNTSTNTFTKTPNIENISFNNGSIKLNLSKPAQVSIDMFDLS
ncbi:MAG: hypothetical protein GX639_15395, partial [Fibrobacter sp.]|nr:hypothetical protein [Fibrobacter sp.]